MRHTHPKLGQVHSLKASPLLEAQLHTGRIGQHLAAREKTSNPIAYGIETFEAFYEGQQAIAALKRSHLSAKNFNSVASSTPIRALHSIMQDYEDDVAWLLSPMLKDLPNAGRNEDLALEISFNANSAPFTKEPKAPEGPEVGGL